MEEIKDRLGDFKYNFLYNLQNYIDTQLLFFGSIKRFDFFKNSSDIDIVIISDNIKSLLHKIQNYLHIDKNSIKKIIQQHSIYDKGFIPGYKIKYEDNENNIAFDLLIYDEKYREKVIKYINNMNFLPFYMIIILYILKFLHYILYIIPKSAYIYLKTSIFYCYNNTGFYLYKKELYPVIMID